MLIITIAIIIIIINITITITIIITLHLRLLRYFSSLDVTGIRGLPRNVGISSSFSITHINCGSAKFVSAAFFMCQNSTSS